MENIFMGTCNEFENKGLRHFNLYLIDNLFETISVFLVYPALKIIKIKKISIDHPNFSVKW